MTKRRNAPLLPRKVLLWILIVASGSVICLTVSFAFSIKPPVGNSTLKESNNSFSKDGTPNPAPVSLNSISPSSPAGITYSPSPARTTCYAPSPFGTTGYSPSTGYSPFPAASPVPPPISESRDEVYNFLLAGTDAVASNTDTIMLMSYNSTDNTIYVLSIPRDTITPANRSNRKINAAYEQGGMAELEKEVADLLSVGINRYVLVNLKGVEKIIDAIGGINFNIPRNLNYDDPLQNLHIHLKKGYQHLNGNQVLQLARYRHDYTNGDIGRVLVQQELITVLANRFFQPANILKLPQIVGIASKSFKTDLSAGEMFWLFDSVKNILPDDTKMGLVPGNVETIGGLSYWLPDKEALRTLISEEIMPD